MCKIRQNYENYEDVKRAFNTFIYTLVWESMDIDEGVQDVDIDDHIKRYCNTHGDQMIALANDSVSKFIKSLATRYEVHCYELNENGDAIDETAKHYNTNDLKTALKKGAEFYRKAKCPQVNIYDNETDKYIAEWD